MKATTPELDAIVGPLIDAINANNVDAYEKATEALLPLGEPITDVFSRFSPTGEEAAPIDNPIFAIMTAAADRAFDPMIMQLSMVNMQQVYYVTCITIGALVKAGALAVITPVEDVEDGAEEDRIAPPNAGE